jgi:ADP-heptose:LPS heptosyltransferase
MTGINFVPEKILVVKAAGIGDLVLAIPALRALRARFPESEIDLLVTPKCSNVLKNCPYINAIHVIRTKGMLNRIDQRDLWSILRTLYRLRKKHYDVLINLYHLFTDRGGSRMRGLCRAVGARYAIGRNTDGRGMFYDDSIPDSWTDPAYERRHELELNLDVVRLLGAEDPGRGLEFWVQNEDRLEVRRILDQEIFLENKGPRIALNLGGDALYKRWPDHHTAALGDLLMQRLSAQVLIVGGEKEIPAADRVISMMNKRPVNLAGKLDILELAAFLEDCDLMVTNDTGPMHLSAAVGTPVVALFGPGKPGRYAPYGPAGFHTLIQHPLDCSPCTDFGCASRECMRHILPEDVCQKVADRLVLKEEVCP